MATFSEVGGLEKKDLMKFMDLVGVWEKVGEEKRRAGGDGAAVLKRNGDTATEEGEERTAERRLCNRALEATGLQRIMTYDVLYCHYRMVGNCGMEGSSRRGGATDGGVCR